MESSQYTKIRISKEQRYPTLNIKAKRRKGSKQTNEQRQSLPPHGNPFKEVSGLEMDSQLRDFLKGNIQGILPHLSEERTEDLIDFLKSKGVKKQRDLRRLTCDVLEGHLNDMVDACDLFDEWQKVYGEGGPSTSRGSGLQSRLANNFQQQPVPTPNMPTFDKDSPYMPASVKEACIQRKRASSSGRNQMVERIVDRCREVVPGLQRSMFNDVALSLVLAYPDTFKDTILVSKHGSDSLAKQLRDKFDNDKRPKNSTQMEKEAPSNKEAYGCIRWNSTLPDSETEDSQEEKRQSLVDMHMLSKKEWDWKIIKKHSEESFFLQMKDINGP
ncbi:hypothetical protein ONE63_008125 [Megalurothrips usitatus]|uniref:Uncharacterized protein n=1 Tax=Megalurothrips usitatus TaxID=439358 RepID=A0AAV7XPY5_9NEOP|nr:hypothetical protein ONE63_008125 [Megalurothrips usitatus]